MIGNRLQLEWSAVKSYMLLLAPASHFWDGPPIAAKREEGVASFFGKTVAIVARSANVDGRITGPTA